VLISASDSTLFIRPLDKKSFISKGQVTIPKMIRAKAQITPGSNLDFQLEKEGTLRVSILTQDISKLKGIIKPKSKKPVSLKEMKEAIRNSSKRTMQ